MAGVATLNSNFANVVTSNAAATEVAQNSPNESLVAVVGKAFFDIGHAPADHSNRRTDLRGYAA